MKHLLLFYLFFICFSLTAQQKFSKEISFVTDNDLYVSVDRDRYYTNGTFLNYRYLTKHKNESLEKKIMQWQIGQEMYTPNKAVVQDIRLHDRPFAAYLYASLGIKRVYKKDKILNTSLQIGVVGPNAFGKELQDFIHNIYNFDEAVGWTHQIKNAFALNLDAEYTDFLLQNKSNTIDASWVNSARLGTVYTNISSGFIMRFSYIPLQKMMNSIAFNTNLNNENTAFKREIESFFYIKPIIRYALYDATLQGSFLNTNSNVTKELVPVVFDVELGFKFTANSFNFGYVFNYNTSKSKGLRYNYGNKYGTVILSYLLR
ncbi:MULTISPECIES: lipid A deacylase LpxR family protein [unclassified Polaribacter]|uniref:lipid A deacylase LpxR family protein n=1 Tax=unclassified Polaribacter TaxID=196858 RepID=UPI0011BE6CD9|nr:MULTISPECIES: lipid A deacylase LpxR family protein [unclassified Polaribacter]TXD50378.1 lipid A deacylase LpxR family protein [Polaribacter sp. IC063]TXD56474.1 lipid A deacylase LpxR family protein [Polaribacter sp. IC066]